jgi:hypothetical protein
MHLVYLLLLLKLIAFHLPNGQDDNALVLNANEQPHSLQQGPVPFTAHFFLLIHNYHTHHVLVLIHLLQIHL